MSNDWIIDGLEVIAKRRGSNIQQGDVEIVEAAIKALRAEVEPSKPTIHKPVWDGTILIGSDCTINGTKVKAGTVLRPGDILPDELSSDMNSSRRED